MSRSNSLPYRTSDVPYVAAQWLSREPRTAAVMDTARRLLEAQSVIQRLIPGAMGQACRVALIEAGKLVLSVPSAAHAAKLRQFAPTLIRKMNEHGWNLNEISVKIQAVRQTMPTQPKKSVNPLGAAGVNAFASIAPAIHPGPLADAIARLLQRHGASR